MKTLEGEFSKEKTEPNNKGQYIAKCRYCDCKIVGYTHTSTNCLRHIGRVHKDVMSEHEFVPKKKCE